MGDLSVFVDESGDVGLHSKYYLVTFVFHDQSRSIDAELVALGRRLGFAGFPLDEAVHAGPLVRREGVFSGMDIGERRRAFNCLLGFARRTGVSCATLSYRKSELGARSADEVGELLRARLVRDMGIFLRDRLGYFTGYDRVIVYYDGGQPVVASAMQSAFESELFGVEFRLVRPGDYRLFQVADLVCTLELLRLKDAANELSRSDLAFFGSAARLRRDYLRQIERLRLG